MQKRNSKLFLQLFRDKSCAFLPLLFEDKGDETNRNIEFSVF
jgi:hypothetical protein